MAGEMTRNLFEACIPETCVADATYPMTAFDERLPHNGPGDASSPYDQREHRANHCGRRVKEDWCQRSTHRCDLSEIALRSC